MKSLISSHRNGALPSQTIAALMRAGFITGSNEENIRPASLDLAISDEIYQVDGIFQPKQGETVRELLALFKKKKHNLADPLARGVMYLARLNEKLSLPMGVYAYCNPKSTSGRIDTHVRILADGVSRYDAITPGWSGELWIAINPKSFPIKLAVDQTLSQVRFFNGDTSFNELELQIAMKQWKLMWHKDGSKEFLYQDLKIRDNDGSVILTLDLKGTALGYECKGTDEVLDLSKINHYDPKRFFKPVVARQGNLHLKKGEFYILSTNEAVRVPPELACEMAPMDERSGDFRSHYAGFIDPGWGWGMHGEGKGRPLTLEVRPFEDIIARHGQPIAKIRFERIIEIPEIIYDQTNSNYLIQQGPKLAKQFKQTSKK